MAKSPLPDNVFGLLAGDFLTSFAGLNLGAEKVLAFTTQNDSLVNVVEKCIEDSYVEDLKRAYEKYLRTLYKYQTLLITTMDSEMTFEQLKTSASISNSLSADYDNLKIKNAQALLQLKSSATCIKNESYQSLSKLLSQIITDASEKNVVRLEILKKNARKIVKANKDRQKIRLKVAKFIAKGDEAKIKLTFRPRKHVDSFEQPLVPRITEKKIQIKNHFKVSFSPGIIFTSGLNDKKFNLAQVMVNDSITNYRIIEEDESKLNYGISALTHFTWSKPYGGIGLNLGLGYLPQNTKISGLVGGSLFFGKDKQVILNGGLAASFSKVLSDAYEINEQFTEVFEIKTKEKLKTGIWIGFGYRL